MISAFVGKIRNGKSYFACKLILDKIAAGGCVYSNLSIRLDPWFDNSYGHDSMGAKAVLKRLYGWDYQEGQFNHLPDADMKNLTKHISPGTADMPVLVVIDEALDFFNSLDRNESQTVLREFLSYIRHSGKFFTDLVFITQSFDEMNNRLRDKISDYYICVDVAKTPLPFLAGQPLPWPWRDFFVVTQKIGKQSSPEFIKRTWVRKNYLIYQSYETTSLHMDLLLGKKSNSDFRKDKMRKKMKKHEMIILYASFLMTLFTVIQARTSKASSPAGSGVPAAKNFLLNPLTIPTSSNPAVVVSGDVLVSSSGSSLIVTNALPVGDLTKSPEALSIVHAGGRVGAYLPRYRRTVFAGDFLDDGEIFSIDDKGVILQKNSGGLHVFFK